MSGQPKTEQAKETVEFWCIKCKTHRTMPANSVTIEKTAKGRNMARATCPWCLIKMAKFVKRQGP